MSNRLHKFPYAIAPKARPRPCVTTASMTPTIVISKPEAHHERMSIRDFHGGDGEVGDDADRERNDHGVDAAHEKERNDRDERADGGGCEAQQHGGRVGRGSFSAVNERRSTCFATLALKMRSTPVQKMSTRLCRLDGVRFF